MSNKDEDIKVIKYSNDNEQNKNTNLPNINEEEDLKINNKNDKKSNTSIKFRKR